MIPIRVPMVVTAEDKRRARVVRSAEEGRIKQRVPQFYRDGTGPCRTVGDPDDFTNDDTRGQSGRDARNRARAICRRCPFAQECEEYATETRQSGVFGGVWLVAGVPQAKE